MKIVQVSQRKVIMGQNTPNLQSPQLKFFLNFKKSVGFDWMSVGAFSVVSGSPQGGENVKNYSKTIRGRRKGSSASQQYEYIINLIYVCDSKVGPNSEDLVSEKSVSISLKSFATNTNIETWTFKIYDFDSKSDMLNAATEVLQDILGLSSLNIETPSQYEGRLNENIPTLPPVQFNGKKVYYYHRLTRIKTSAYEASVVEFYVDIIRHKFLYMPCWNVTYLESGIKSGESNLLKEVTSFAKAVETIDMRMALAKKNKGYVGPESDFYLPEGINSDNWDFVLNQWKQKNKPVVPDLSKTYTPMPDVPQTPTQQTSDPEQLTPDFYDQMMQTPLLDLRKLVSQKQNFEGYFSGEIPDYAGELVGTPSVDASQISSIFGGTNEAIALVNSYTSDALKNVAYIFNFSKGGAYGVYIPELDRAIKTKALQKQLEQKGYKIVDENGILTAHPTEEGITPDQIDKDINTLWEQLNSGGGSALGINMSDVLSATQQNTSDIMNKMRQQAPDIPQQIEGILKDVLGVYHLAAIILHESSHSKGGDEGKAGSDEQAFRSWAQNDLNSKYQSKLSAAGLEEYYSPLELSSKVIHALSKNWYKTAQGMMGRLNYSPYSGAGKPRGSDISGRYHGTQQGEGLADWSMLLQKDQSIPIESRLNNGNMYPLERTIDPTKDIIEEQLRKQFVNDSKPNVQLLTEELLSISHDASQGYKTLEEMLEELRPQPLMIPIKKAAMIQEARKVGDTCLFGWYNNLDLDDGSTIPGLSDRVMAWDDRDESFSAEEDTISSQSRYNPEMDLKGFYYRWIEPRNKPQLFDDMTRDLVNTHPAKRWAATLDPDVSKILSILKLIEEKLVNEEIKSTRLVVSEEMSEWIQKVLGHEGIKIKAYKLNNEDDIYSVWVYGSGSSEESLDQAEQYFQNQEGSEQYKEIVESLLETNSRSQKAIEKIVGTAKELCKSQNVSDLYILGEYARKIFEGEATPNVSSLDFSCESIDSGLKIAGLLANKLGVNSEHVILGQVGISFIYRGIRVFFSRSPYFHEIGEKMQEHRYNIEDPVLRDLCNKDFTINMMGYDILDMKIIDPIGVKSDIKNKIVKTLFDPSFIIEANPMVIMRAMSLKIDGYELDEDLARSMIEGSANLCSGRFSPQRLRFTEEVLRSKNTDMVDELFGEFGIQGILEKEI